MRLAVSNIAWFEQEEAAVVDKMRELGVSYVELAPTKKWQDPTKISDEEAVEYVKWWNNRGVKVAAFQSMLFNRPDLKLFDNPENTKMTEEYLERFIHLAGVMGANRMVFGSPKNRKLEQLNVDEADNIGRGLFKRLGEVANKNNVIFCVEPNAPQYGCDFITTAREGLDMVKTVDSDGFGLHLDTACMHLAGDDIDQSIIDSAETLRHFHISAPMLEHVNDKSGIDYGLAISALKKIKYDGLISIEMKPGELGTNVSRVEESVKYIQNLMEY